MATALCGCFGAGKKTPKSAHVFPTPIKTLVILCMENRSFDHMLGFMKEINPEINGLTGTESQPLSLTVANAGVVTVSDQAPYVDPGDPGHSYQAIALQIFGSETNTTANPPPMNGFAVQAETEQKGLSKDIMSAFAPDHVPIYKTLVQQFAVVDRWFASVPSSTQPNRQYLHSATSHGLMSNNKEMLTAGLPQKTIFESVEEAGLSFGIYYQQVPNTLFYRNLRKLKYIDNFRPFDLTFKDHAKRGVLPNYTVIEPRYFDLLNIPANDDHPVHDVAQGQRLIKEVYETLRASPQWKEMLLLIVYDEHGGFYDHVPTPIGVPSPDGIVGGAPPYTFDFTRLGVRVPAILVSPYIQAGTVVHKPNQPTPTSEFEHSSICATAKKLFNLPGGFLTKRDAWAGTFDVALTRKTPRTDCPVKLPAPPATLKLSKKSKVGGVKIAEQDAKDITVQDKDIAVQNKDIAVQDKELAPSNKESGSVLSEFQEELVWLACSLTGQEIPDCKTVEDAVKTVFDGIAKFFDAAATAKAKGLDPDHVVGPGTTAL